VRHRRNPFRKKKNVETLLQYFQALHPRRWFTGLWLNFTIWATKKPKAT
jgi:hypothetical protein